MQVVKPSFSEVLAPSLFEKVEVSGRTCYKSENLITPGSAVDFTKRILSYNHGSVLEHAVLVFKVDDEDLYSKIEKKHYPFVNCSFITYPIVSMNLRAFYALYLKSEDDCLLGIYAFMENHYSELFKNQHNSQDEKSLSLLSKEEILKLSEEEKDMHLHISIRFITDRGVTHELVRHRLASFSQESTRYCNYGKEKFNHEITFVKTYGLNKEQELIWEKAMKNAEDSYFSLLESGAKPEQARSVLPNSLKTEIVVTCCLKEWKLIFSLRCASAAHPDIRFLMQDVESYFKEKGYLA